MLKIIDAFSYAREYCDVGLWVKASNLFLSACSPSPNHLVDIPSSSKL